jgi:hypothetical protein
MGTSLSKATKLVRQVTIHIFRCFMTERLQPQNGQPETGQKSRQHVRGCRKIKVVERTTKTPDDASRVLILKKFMSVLRHMLPFHNCFIPRFVHELASGSMPTRVL